MSDTVDTELTVLNARLDQCLPPLWRRPPMPSGDGHMDRAEIHSLYEWAEGACFRCARAGQETTLLGEIDPPSGVHYEIRACVDCVLDLEAERWRRAQRTGGVYVPGQLG